jgi:hypothetical protein
VALKRRQNKSRKKERKEGEVCLSVPSLFQLNYDPLHRKYICIKKAKFIEKRPFSFFEKVVWPLKVFVQHSSWNSNIEDTIVDSVKSFTSLVKKLQKAGQARLFGSYNNKDQSG